ncbi:Cell division protein DivIC (FtsB), stabilizes FtsL against RasP cleavage [Imhoffiella purpurea]|uniref:Cell division protein DivIC (FtsB), stabilizes FtsL against RasP cleavage n=1 Tax=Imhoffiella purpurea TaxID=1249627 RepID=W9VCM2_9GAMM|nr:Cell division protein DivIC (FtsB), stabilizes FtsL against RasP cleavage [Imhoffiella purpurea]
MAAAWMPVLAVQWQFVGLALLVSAVADLILVRRLPSPNLERRMGRALPLGVWSSVRLRIENTSDRYLRLRVHDLHPSDFALEGLPRRLRLRPRERAVLEYRLKPHRRGEYPLSGCDLALRSPLGLWHQRRTLPLADLLRVFPNFSEISRYTLLAANDQLAQLGVRRLQRRGLGAEFHQLREYRQGDELRQIDWKATSRMRKLISREYQDERDQRLVFLLDCGRRMRHEDAGRGHLDEALNALLLLAYVAVRQGDAVGLMTYGGERRWFAPRKEPSTVKRLLESIYDLQPGLEAADPLQAARELLTAVPRRALVVVITNSRDEEQDGLEQAAALLRRRHLVVIADLRESALDRALERPVRDLRDALRFHAVHDWLAERRRHRERLQHIGVHALDLLPSQLAIALVNRYFAIKRSGSL